LPAAREAQALVAVSDTGIGIAPEDRAGIFEELDISGRAAGRDRLGRPGLGVASPTVVPVDEW
jgi:signal transduction histidine kinase